VKVQSVMDAAGAIFVMALMFLPAILFFVRSPGKPDNGDVLMALVGISVTLTILAYLGNWLLPKNGGYWIAALGWLLMLAYAWTESGRRRADRKRSRQRKSRTDV